MAEQEAQAELARVKADDTEGIDALQSIIADLRAQLRVAEAERDAFRASVSPVVAQQMEDVYERLRVAEAELASPDMVWLKRYGRETAVRHLRELTAKLADLATTTTLLDRAKETLETNVYFTPETGDDLCCCCERSVVEGHSPLCEIGLVLAAIDAHVLASAGN